MSKINNFNHCIFEGFVTHAPEYYPEKGKLLCLSIAVNSDDLSDKIDNPMYLDVKVSGVNEALANAIVQGHEVRVMGRLQSKTIKRQGQNARYFHLYVPDPMLLTLLAKPKKITPALDIDQPVGTLATV